MITIYAPGHMDVMDSYGLLACQLLRYLNKSGVEAHAIAMGKAQLDTQPDDIASLMARPLRPSYGGILLGYPTTYEAYGQLANAGKKIALTMFESSKIPPEWVPILNGVDAVIVPSKFCKDSFAACGVEVPIHVVPLGINEVYKPVKRPANRPLTFLAFLDRGARKGGHVAIQAFCLAFGDRKDVRLILKSRDPKVRMTATNDNIDIIQQDMSESELAALYGRCDVLINPNKGEGFGLIPREFAATGGIALTTEWGGTADHLDKWGWALPHSLVPADWKGVKKFQNVDLGEWAEPDIEGIAAVLQEIAANRRTYQIAAMSRANNVHQLYSWPRFANHVYAVWESVANGN